MSAPYHMVIKGTCLVPGCSAKATRIMNLRMRMENTNCVKGFGENILGAAFCDRHGESGADITISYEPRDDRSLFYEVRSGDAQIKFRGSIKNGNGGQEQLL